MQPLFSDIKNMEVEIKQMLHEIPRFSIVSFPIHCRARHPSEWRFDGRSGFRWSPPFFRCACAEMWDSEMRREDGSAGCLESRAFKRRQSWCSSRRSWEEWPPPPRPRWRFHFNPQRAPLLEARRTHCCRRPATMGRLSLMIFKGWSLRDDL